MCFVFNVRLSAGLDEALEERFFPADPLCRLKKSDSESNKPPPPPFLSTIFLQLELMCVCVVHQPLLAAINAGRLCNVGCTPP